MLRVSIIALALLVGAAAFCAAAWDYSYEGNALPGAPINATDEVTHNSPDDTREIVGLGPGRFALHIVDSSINRSRYRVDLDSLYGTGVPAGTVETRQRFAASSDMNNIAIMMRQNTEGASAEIRVGYYDAGGGRRGLWNAKAGQFLGPVDPSQFYKLRMVLDEAAGGRLYVNDSYFADLAAAPGASPRLAFGAGSTLGAGEVYIDYFRWKHATRAAPGDPNDPGNPADLISPRITSLPAAAPAAGSVTITWTTNTPASSTVRWGAGWTCPNSSSDPTPVTNHSVTIGGLQPGTTYRFYVESTTLRDPDIARSGIQSFTTADTFRISAGPFVWTSTDGKSATVSWTTTFDSDSKLFHRPKGSGNWSETYNAAQTTSHALALADLSPNSTYEYYVVSARAGSPDAQSPVAEFFTYVYASRGSLLTNGDFELGNLVGWVTAAGSDPGAIHTGPWLDRIMPHSGSFMLGAESDGGARNGTIYQSVTSLPPGGAIYATAWIHTCEVDAAGAEQHESAFCQIGIDTVQEPSGPIDPTASTVRWSAPVYTANSGPWLCIGAVTPRAGATHAIVFLRHLQTADGGFNATCFDDVVLATSAPVSITSGPTVTQVTETSATVEWATDVAASGFVQFGLGDLGSCTFTGFHLDPAPETTHSVTLDTYPGNNYVVQAGSACPLGLVLSPPVTFSTPMNTDLLNAGFEATDAHSQPTVSPWMLFQYDINQLPGRSGPPGPAGGPIDGLVGPYPSGSAGWHGVTCEPTGGSHLIGAYADLANKNGGVYQRVKVVPGKVYAASMRFLTHQQPVDPTHPAGNTACAVGIDPTGGTNVLASSVVWSPDKSSAVDGQWDDISVKALAASDIITIFCIVEQRLADTVHLNVMDNVKIEVSDIFTGTLGQMKQQPAGTPVRIESTILTYARIPESPGSPARLYVEEPDRTSGIGIISTDPVLWTDPPYPGDKIDADGTLAVIGGEAVVNNASISKTPGWPTDVPPPLGMAQTALGGGPFGIQPGVTGGSGLSTVGLLVKVAGKVTSGTVDDGWIPGPTGQVYAYIDDGSGLRSSCPASGLKIITDPLTAEYRPIALNQIITVVGVSSVEQDNGSLRPVVLVYDWTGIDWLVP